MASLTKVAITTRRIIRYGIYLILAIIFIRISIYVTTKIYRYFFPAPPPPPTVVFGPLPALPFPEQPKPTNLFFTLQTPDLKLPKLPPQVDVYEMPQIQPNIQALDLAKQTATRLGFNPNGRELVETVYLFQRDDAPSTLNMNIITRIFSISYDINADPTVTSRVPPAPEAAIGLAKNYLRFANLLEKDIAKTDPTYEFYRVERGSFVSAPSLSDSGLIKVNIYREPLSDLPPATPKANEANIWFMISGATKPGSQIIAAEYHYFPVDAEKKATYPIKTSEQVWEELKAGQAYFASVDEDAIGEIIIRKIYLAYYDAGQYAKYYQPVVVFEGDNNFVAYVPAIAPEFYATQE